MVRHKIGSIFLFLAAMLFVFSPLAFADGFFIDNQSCANAGEEVTFTISVSNAPRAVASFGFEISFDGKVLEYVRFEPGNLLSSSKFSMCQFNKVNNNTVKVGGLDPFGTGGIAKGESGTVGKITFKVLECKSSQVTVAKLGDDMAGWPAQAGSLLPGIDFPQEAENVGQEDDSGQIDIEGKGGRIGQEVLIPIRIQTAPQTINSFGFMVTYPADILEYAGYERGELVAKFPMFDVINLSSGNLRIGGMDYGQGITKGTSGYLVRLRFKVKGEKEGCYPLELTNLVDDLAKFSKSGGYFCLDNTPPEIFCPQERSIAQVNSNGVPINNPEVIDFLRQAIAYDNIDGQVKVRYYLLPGVIPSEILTVKPDMSEGVIIIKKDNKPIPEKIELAVEKIERAKNLLPEALDDNLDTSKPSIRPGKNLVVFVAQDRTGNFSYCLSTLTVEPIECLEDDSGKLDIPGTSGKVGKEVLIPVRLQNAIPIPMFSFEVEYNPSVLEYTGYELGELTKPLYSLRWLDVIPLGLSNSGRLMIIGMSNNIYPPYPTSQGIISDVDGTIYEVEKAAEPLSEVKELAPLPQVQISGNLLFLKFIVKDGLNHSCYPVKLEHLTNEMSGLSIDSISGGCFCVNNCDGDQNGDGRITPADALIVFKCYLGSGPCGDCADVDENGKVTPADALCLFKKYLGQPSCLDD